MKPKHMSTHSASSIHSPTSPKPSSPTNWHRSGAASERSVICARSSYRHGLTHRPIGEINTSDVLAIINSKKAHRAAGLLALVKRLYGWAIDQQVYGLDGNRATGSRYRRLSVRRSRAADASTTPRYSHSGKPPRGWAIRLVRSSNCSPHRTTIERVRASIVARGSRRPSQIGH